MGVKLSFVVGPAAVRSGVWRPEVRSAVLILLVLAAGWLKDPRLLSPSSLNTVLLAVPLLLVVALGQMLVIVSRGIDVSVGSMVGLAGICLGLMFRSFPNLPMSLAAGAALGMGVVFGLINGLLVARLAVPPVVATLGTMSIFRGLTFIISRGQQIDSNDIPNALTAWSLQGPFKIGQLSVPWLLIIALAFFALVFVLAHRTVWGLRLFAIGSNSEAARLRAVPVFATVIGAYAICGALAGFAGLMYASKFGFVNPATAGLGLELMSIAAVVVGGCDIRGGAGTVIGAFLGCVFLSTVFVGLSVLHIEADWQQLVYGAVIIAALWLDALAAKWPRFRSASR